jgi:hypothetical protein
MLSLATVITFSSEASSLQLFVDNAAQSNGKGDINSPFSTLFEARDYIRALKSSGAYPQSGIRVPVGL